MMYSISGLLFVNISSRFCSINKLYVGYIIHLTSIGRSIGNSGQGLTFLLKSKLDFKTIHRVYGFVQGQSLFV